MSEGTCVTCRNDAPELLKGECRTCYTYRYRNGVERPEDVQIRHATRFNERQAEREYVYRYRGGGA